MIVDFHTHVFPDKLASATIEKLQSVAGMKAHTDGTLAGLKASMAQNGVDWSVVLPVVTRPHQFDTINRYAASINGHDGILSFGGIHPDNDDPAACLDTIKSLGLRGIKLHPDYQQTFIDDPRCVTILREATARELFVTIHAGIDIGLPQPVHCPPDRMAAVLDRLPDDGGGYIILAHTGGWRQWDEVERLLCGRRVLLDLSFTLGFIETEQLCRIIRRHGVENCLFATDSPWGGQAEMLEQFRALPLTEQEKEAILGGNAQRLLVW